MARLATASTLGPWRAMYPRMNLIAFPIDKSVSCSCVVLRDAAWCCVVLRDAA